MAPKATVGKNGSSSSKNSSKNDSKNLSSFSSHGNGCNKTMKAPGGGGVVIDRDVFEKNPKSYFDDLGKDGF